VSAGRLRIVVDTNVLIGALTKPTGHGARVLEAWRDGRVEVVVSEATLREAELVLGGGWVERLASRDSIRGLLDELRQRGVPVAAKRIGGLPLKDEGDRRLVEAAADGGARYLVTTDREVLRYRGHGDTEFVTPTELLRSGALG
jgi:putative PIN family toxin of toxin-antitoxin system